MRRPSPTPGYNTPPPPPLSPSPTEWGSRPFSDSPVGELALVEDSEGFLLWDLDAPMQAVSPPPPARSLAGAPDNQAVRDPAISCDCWDTIPILWEGRTRQLCGCEYAKTLLDSVSHIVEAVDPDVGVEVSRILARVMALFHTPLIQPPELPPP